ncbi:MAG: hypothetical protein Q4C88_04265 [Akkermansia sp.]|nr:hypothetical protein [Akkermansia sp.]
MLKRRKFLMALVLGAALCSCDTQYSHATPEAAQELAQLMQEIQDGPSSCMSERLFPDWEAVAEFQQLYERFHDADDTRLTTPGGVSILHAACFFKKPELARCLLADGADPNAATEAGLTPLTLAVGEGAPDDDDEEVVLQIMKTLHCAGAQPAPEPLANAARAACAGARRERVFAALLDMGCPPSEDSLLHTVILGWNELLQRQGDFLKTRPQKEIDNLIEVVAGCYEDDCTPIIETLLSYGPNVSRKALDTALMVAANAAGISADGETLAYAVPTSETLLRLGANPQAVIEDNEEKPSAADIICAVPAWAEALRRAGYDIKPSPPVFTEGEELHHQVIRADMLRRGLPAGDADAFHRVAALLTETHDDMDCCCEHDIVSSALCVLLRTDPQKTSAYIAALPLWRDLETWEQSGGTNLLPAMTSAVQDNRLPLSLPPQHVCRIAGEMNSRGMREEACSLIALLGAMPTQEAADTLQRLAADAANPALQAGALCAQLDRAGLPLPEEYAVENWLAEHPGCEKSPAVQTALLLTSTVRLWAGEMSPQEQQDLLRAMREIGAAEAAEKYAAIIQSLDNPEALDEIEGGDQAWKFRLKTRIAEYILRHAADFKTAR